MDAWNPNLYEKFKNERSQPFWDLMELVDSTVQIDTAVDLGCGTGELTSEVFHKRFKPKMTLGIDNSTAMLAEAKKYESTTLAFKECKMENFLEAKENEDKFDLVLSNAAIHVKLVLNLKNVLILKLSISGWRIKTN